MEFSSNGISDFETTAMQVNYVALASLLLVLYETKPTSHSKWLIRLDVVTFLVVASFMSFVEYECD